MIYTIKATATYSCSLERAFKTPMLCDVAKIHTGYGVMPKVTHVSDDENWGQPGSSKKIHAAKSLTQAGGFVSMDHILERVENQYWKIKVDDFQTWMLGFDQFIGEWKTTEQAENRILIEYTYHLHAKQPVFYPLCWLFAKTFWKIYMKRVLENVWKMVEDEETYLYD